MNTLFLISKCRFSYSLNGPIVPPPPPHHHQLCSLLNLKRLSYHSWSHHTPIKYKYTRIRKNNQIGFSTFIFPYPPHATSNERGVPAPSYKRMGWSSRLQGSPSITWINGGYGACPKSIKKHRNNVNVWKMPPKKGPCGICDRVMAMAHHQVPSRGALISSLVSIVGGWQKSCHYCISIT